MNKKFFKPVTSLLLSAAVVLSSAGCRKAPPEAHFPSAQTVDLLQDITPHPEQYETEPRLYATEVTDFGIQLLQNCDTADGNRLISPLSVIYALSMTANGAKGQTLEEMESVFGANVQDLNTYLQNHLNTATADQHPTLHLANSIWFTDDPRFSVNRDFLQHCANYHRADIYQTTFNDQAVEDINNWVSRNTDQMVPEILDQIPPDALMYLINAVAFDAQWASPYETYQITDGSFTTEDGQVQSAQYLNSEEGTYLCGDNEQGFMKYYEGHRYAFAALLPDEGMALSDYVASLSGSKIQDLLTSPQYKTVDAKLPKFTTEYDAELSQALGSMGMASAFDPKTADFSGIGHSQAGNICISRILHKTYIDVNEHGTRAAASTVVEMTDACAPVGPEEIITLHLDRPFLYMIIDTQTNAPIFLGTVAALPA